MEYFATPKSQKNDDLEVTGISRSGRVRKKSSKLVDFESPDDFTEQKIKRQKAQQQLHAQQLLEKYQQQLQQKSSQLNSIQQNNSVQQTNTLYQDNVYQQRQNFEAPRVHFKEEVKNESSSEDEEESSESESDDNANANNTNENANGFENNERTSDESDSSDDDDDEDDDDDDEEDVVDPLMIEEGEEVVATGFTKLEPPEQNEIPSQAKSSLYMLEKYKKKLIIKDGKVINKPTKIQRKDKGKTRFTAYMLWAKEARQQLLEHNPNLDFSAISKRLGELWATVPNLEKYNWRKRAKRLAMKTPMMNKDEKMPPPASRKFINKQIVSRNIILPKKTIQLGTPVVGTKVPVSPPSNKVGKDLYNEALLGTGMYKVTGTQPIDIAAHLTLLGESLTIIGKRLKEHEGQITVSGSLPLLLDSLLCALGPLLCLTQQIPEMNGANPEKLSGILENVAYIMPGM